MKSSDIPETVAQSSFSSEAPSSHSVPPPPPSPKWLLSAVIIMGVLIVIAVGALLWVVIHRIQHPKEVQSVHAPSVITQFVHRKEAAAPSMLPLATLDLILHKDEHLQSLTARPDGSMAVILKTEYGAERVVIWVPEQARISAELELKSLSEKVLK